MNRINSYLIILTAFTLLLLSGSKTYGQLSESNHTDNKGLKQGKWKKADAAGRLIYEGYFVDNHPEGLFTYYDSTARVRATSEFTEKGTKAYTITYNRLGKKSSEGIYLNEKREGIWKFYNEDDILVSEEYYENGVPVGTWKNYYQNGNLLEEIDYKYGLKEGTWKQYFYDGPLKLSATYENGKLEGLATFFHPNGRVKISGPYKNNFKDGVWMYLNDKGVAEKKEVWSAGFLQAEEYYDKALERMVKEEKTE
ncbi:MAG: toxin-antitoxin system YwqK family antitoxin [Lentimicrobium sp.]|nr:toxin-antitoxin system YwqK family antitoxin [Lentimicrobium sp.]